MASVDEFIKQEELKMNWLDKVFMNYPEIYSTKELARTSNTFTADTEKIIRPSLFNKMVFVIFLIPQILALLILLNMLFKKLLIPVTIGALLFVCLLIWINILNTFLNRKYIYTIKLNKDHIEIDKKIIPWTKVSETQIMMRLARRGRSSCLVIFTADNQVHTYSLSQFAISDKKLSTLIELYKTKGDQPT